MVTEQLLRDTWNSLRPLLGWSALAFAVALFLLWAERRYRERSAKLATMLAGALVALSVSVGLFKAWRVLWLCDDAFITLHYADNFARGHGLVFNVGEWVEGYTNFLWALGLGLLGKLGFDLPRAALFGNLLSFALALVTLTAFVRRACQQAGLAAPVVVFSTWAMALSSAFTTFGSSGLETMPAAFLVCLGLFASTFGRGPLWSGLILTAAALTRPDHILYGVALGLGFVAEGFFTHREFSWYRRVPWKRAFSFAAPFVFIFIPYWLWRWNAYGDFYPNTYYAKSGGETYLPQGFVYLGHFLLTTGVWLALPVLLFAIFGKPASALETRLRVFITAAVLLMGTYVVRVGGDFMEHRFFITLLPLIAVAIEISLRLRAAKPGVVWRGLWRGAVTVWGLAAFAIAVTPVKIIGRIEKKWNLAAEETFYPVVRVYPEVQIQGGLYDISQTLKRTFPTGGPAPLFATGCVGMPGYYSRLPIFDTYGLVNRQVAHKPVGARGRPGHEKHADFNDAWTQGVTLADVPFWNEWSAETAASLPGLSLWLLRYEPSVAAALIRNGGSAPRPEVDIARYAQSTDRHQVVRALSFYRRFLERVPNVQALLKPLEGRLAAISDFEVALPEGGRVTGSFHLAKGTLPPGASGEGWLTSQGGTGTFSWQGPAPAEGALRLSLGGTAVKDSTLRVSVEDDSGWRFIANEALTANAQLTTREWKLEGAVKQLRVEVKDGDEGPGHDVLIDALRWTPVGESTRLAFLKAPTIDGERLGELRKIEDEVPVSAIEDAPWRAQWVQRLRFDEPQWPPEITVEGTAFGLPVTGALPNQTGVTGARGPRFVNSYHGADAATGRLTLQLPDAQRLAVNVLVGGGDDCKLTYVALKVGAREAARVCGRKDEVLRPAVLLAENPKGEPMTLEAVDKSSTGWGHLLLDDVMVLIPDDEVSAR